MIGASAAGALGTATSIALFAMVSFASTTLAGSRSAADGKYVVHDTVDAGGGRAKSQNSGGPVYTNDGSLGGIGGVSVATAAAPARMAIKHRQSAKESA